METKKGLINHKVISSVIISMLELEMRIIFEECNFTTYTAYTVKVYVVNDVCAVGLQVTSMVVLCIQILP